MTGVNVCNLNTDNNLHYCHQDVVDAGTSLLNATGDSGGPWFTTAGSGSSRTFNAIGIQSLNMGAYPCTTRLGTNQECAHRAAYTEAEYAIAIDYNSYVNHP